MNKQSAVIGILGLTAVGVAAGAAARFWSRRSRALPLQPEAPPTPLLGAVQADASPDGGSLALTGIDPTDSIFDELPPDSTVFEPEPLSDRNITARPHGYAHASLSADDYEAISADDLGAAYLARATDSASEDENDDPSSLDEIPGFRIIRVN